MTPLAWFLAGIIAASAISGFLGIWTIETGRYSSSSGWPRYIVIGYVIVITILLAGLVRYFVGWSVPEAFVPRSTQRRIAHTGYYFARNGEFKLVGDRRRDTFRLQQPDNSPTTERESLISQLLPSEFFGKQDEAGPETIEKGFMRPGLAAEDSLTLKPVWKGERADEWDLTFRISDNPMRIYRSDDRSSPAYCINVPPDQWFSDGDSLVIERQDGNRTSFVSIKWSVGQKYFWPMARVTNSYYFSSGTRGGPQGTETLDKGPILMSDRVVADGITLGGLLRRGKTAFYSQVGTIDEEWWSLFRYVVLTREERGNLNSRIGFLIKDPAFRTAGVRIYKKSVSGTLQPITSGPGPTTLRIPTTSIISHGFGASQDRFDLKLSSEVAQDPMWGQVVRVELVNPEKWPLIPETDKEFIIASTSDYIPLDGYIADIGDSLHPFYAKARVGPGFDELFINDGRNLDTDQDDKPVLRKFALNEPASLGDYDQGVLLALVPSQSDRKSVV